jgi:5-methyltetrahydrofolate--homocysteine methyltransferase
MTVLENVKASVINMERDGVRVMVGGAPVTEEYAEQIGADGYAPDAAAAVKLAERLMVELKGRTVTAG